MAWYQRLFNLARRERLSRDIDRELSFHVAERIDQLIDDGVDKDEARRMAIFQFGNYTLQMERTQETDIPRWIESVARDVRYAARGLRRNPGFTLVAILTLGLGIGANTALFSTVNGILLRKLPVERPDQLVWLRWIGGHNPAANRSGRYGYFDGAIGSDGSFSHLAVERFRDATRFSGFTIEDWDPGRPFERATTLVGHHNFLGTLEMRLLTGRRLTDEDYRTGPPVAIVNEAFARKYFPGGDPIGTRLRNGAIAAVPISIIGVMADAKFSSLREDAQPMLLVARRRDQRRGVINEVRAALPFRFPRPA